MFSCNKLPHLELAVLKPRLTVETWVEWEVWVEWADLLWGEATAAANMEVAGKMAVIQLPEKTL